MSCHVARVCQDFLNQNHFRVLPLPALSPDLSPIEHLWDDLSRRVRHRQNQPETLQELGTHLCTSGTTSYKPLSNDWLILCVGDANVSLLQEVGTHISELRKPSYYMTIYVCP